MKTGDKYLRLDFVHEGVQAALERHVHPLKQDIPLLREVLSFEDLLDLLLLFLSLGAAFCFHHVRHGLETDLSKQRYSFQIHKRQRGSVGLLDYGKEEYIFFS